MIKSILLVVSGLVLTSAAWAAGFRYEDIAKRHQDSALGSDKVANAEMQGECLVGLKELNFRKKQDYDAIAEWSNFRTASLLEYYSPCEVLIIMEVAQQKLRESQ